MTTIDLLVPPTSSSARTSPLELLQRLAPLQASGPLFVTLYLRLDAESRVRNRYRIAAKDAIRRTREMADQLDLSHPEREAVLRDLTRMEVQVEDAAGLPHSPGLALFACESLDLFEVLPLPRVLETRVLLGERPRLAEAFAAVQAFGRIVVALVDRTHARFFEVTGSEVNELSGLALPATRGGKFHGDAQDSPGTGERHYHNRIQEERRRHAALVARQLEDFVSQNSCSGIVLAGPGRTVAEQQRFLSRTMAARVVGTLPLNPTATTAAEVAEAVRQLRAASERFHETALLAELGQGVGTGWAVNGVKPTLRALGRGQVKVLIVPAGQTREGFLCSQSGRLTLTRADCQREGEPVPVQDLVSEVLDDALNQRVEIEVIDDPELAGQIEGMAALLRFR